MKAILKILKIDETLTQAPKKDTIFSKIKNNVPHESHLNYMADLIFLPKTKNKYIKKYDTLLVLSSLLPMRCTQDKDTF